MSTPAKHDFLEAALRAMAPAAVLERGRAYYQSGAVRGLVCADGSVRAIVHGGVPYVTRLTRHGDALLFRCSCPMGQQGKCCKHAVALGLAWRASAAPSHPISEETPKVSLPPLSGVQAKDVATLCAWVEALPAPKDNMSFVELWDCLEWLHEAVDVLEVETPRAPVAVREALGTLFLRTWPVLGGVDDQYGNIYQLMVRMEQAHRKAVQASPPEDPVALAEHLYRLESVGRGHHFARGLTRHVGSLGHAGARHYWERLSADLAACDEEDRRVELERILDELRPEEPALYLLYRQQRSGDALACLELARMEDASGHHHAAQARVEAALKEHPGERGLCDFLERRLQAQGRHGEAMKMAWQAFTHHPDLHGWLHLLESAKRNHQGGRWREKAMDWLEERDPEIFSGQGMEMLQLGVTEHQVNEAWTWLGATAAPTPDGEALVRRRALTHPDEAARAYLRWAEGFARHGGDKHYRCAAAYLERAVDCLKQGTQTTEAATVLQEFRLAHGRRKKLIQLINHLRG